MRAKALILDADGVLLDFNNAFLRFHDFRDEQGDILPTLDYDYVKAGVFDSVQEMIDGITQFQNTEEWRTLRPLALVTVLEMLRNAGIELHVVTQITDPKWHMLRIQNLTVLYGNVFNSIRFTTHGQSKLDVAMDIENVVGIVEDKPETLWEFTNFGIPAYGVVHSYNRKALYENPVCLKAYHHDVNKLLIGVLKHTLART